MVEMGMGENDRIDAARFDWKRRPVLQAQRLESLEQAAIDQQFPAVMFHEIFRAGNRTRAAEKGEVQAHAATFRNFDSAIKLSAQPGACLIHVNIRGGDPEY